MFETTQQANKLSFLVLIKYLKENITEKKKLRITLCLISLFLFEKQNKPFWFQLIIHPCRFPGKKQQHKPLRIKTSTQPIPYTAASITLSIDL